VRRSTDFGVMMTPAAAPATLGLLQGSGAVVIGAMQVSPLIRAGIALVPGSVKLMCQAVITTVVGVGLGLGLETGRRHLGA
jgi:uncharacterized membrane protein